MKMIDLRAVRKTYAQPYATGLGAEGEHGDSVPPIPSPLSRVPLSIHCEGHDDPGPDYAIMPSWWELVAILAALVVGAVVAVGVLGWIWRVM